MRFRAIRIAVFVLIAGLHISAAGDQAQVDEILLAAERAVGSPKEIARINSITSVADCIGPKGTYKTTVISFRDNLTLFDQTYSYKAGSSVLINGGAVWGKQAGTDLVLLDPFQRMVARLHEYQKMAFDPRSFFKDFEYTGEEIFAGIPALRIKAKTELNMSVDLYFDRSKKRFVGYRLLIPNSTETVTNVFSAWKRVGNLTLPSSVDAIDSSGKWALNFRSIRLNSADRRSLEIPPRIADQAELLRLHEQQKTAHLSYNADLFVEMFADSLTQLQRGEVSTRTREENRARFRSYFSTFKFKEWENIKPPAIRVSKDGSMAVITVQKRVRGTYKNDIGNEVDQHVIYAWLEVWEKIGGKWKLITIASTEKDGSK